MDEQGMVFCSWGEVTVYLPELHTRGDMSKTKTEIYPDAQDIHVRAGVTTFTTDGMTYVTTCPTRILHRR